MMEEHLVKYIFKYVINNASLLGSHCLIRRVHKSVRSAFFVIVNEAVIRIIERYE